MNLLDRLFPGDDAVLLDGAMGTALRNLGWPAADATVLANLRAPGMVSTVHGACRDAGARVLQTNTFGALLGMAAAGACGTTAPADSATLRSAASIGEQRLQAVRAAVRIARKVASAHASRPGGPARVAGSLDAYDLAFHGPRLDDVVRLLVEEGVDLLVFETCNTIRDAQIALEMHHEYAGHLPAIVCVSSTDGTREDRKRVEETAAFIAGSERGPQRGVELGLNCCRGPLETFRLATSLPVMPRWLKPSTGSPDDPVDDNVMAAFARAARQRGVRFIGGCCGTSADTLMVMAAALRSTAT